MQGFVGAHLEKNMQLFMDMQQKVASQPGQVMTPEAWGQLFSVQNPAMQALMGNYMDQSRAAMDQLQDQIQRNSEQMLNVMGFRRPN